MIQMSVVFLGFVLAVSLGLPVWILAGSVVFPMTFADFLYLAGRYFALSAFLVLTFQYIWTAKFRFLERIRSYDRRVAVHRTMGIFGILAVSLHPILILIYYATQGVPLSINVPMAFGFASLLILLFIIGSTFLGRIWNIRYESWKRMHWFTFPVLTLAFYHSLQLGSDIYGAARVTWFLLWGFHLVVLLGKLVHKIRAWHSTSRVVSVESLSPGTITIGAEKLRGSYLPGQFGFISVKLGKRWEAWHPFSLTSHQEEDHISMTVKNVGDFSSALADVRPGDLMKTDLGYGAFSHHFSPDQRYVFVAAGVGITPIYAILKDLTRLHEDVDVILIYCVHGEPDILYRSDLERWFAERPGWQLHITCTSQPDWPGETGRVKVEMMDRLCSEDYSGTFFLCGPLMMTKTLAAHLRRKGVPRRKIRREQFVFLP